MSFRRDRDKSLEWHKWVEAHQDRLITIGIPREVWEDKSNWQRFLWHGHSSEPTDWRNIRFSMDNLNEEQLRLLHRFLADYGPGPSCCGSTVWDSLQRQSAQSNEATATQTDPE